LGGPGHRVRHADVLHQRHPLLRRLRPRRAEGGGAYREGPRHHRRALRRAGSPCWKDSGERIDATELAEREGGGVTSIAITGGRVVPIEGDPIDGGTVLIADGRIAAVGGPDLKPPPGADVIDAAGRWVLPGLVDAHTHLGAREEGEGWAGHDTNELTGPIQAHVRVLDAVNPADEGFRDAIAGGVLTAGITPVSGNPIGGQTVAIHCWGRTVDDMVLRSPAGMKSALGENPKRVTAERRVNPSSRLGTAAAIRTALVETLNYLEKDQDQESAQRVRHAESRDLKHE